MPQDSLWSYELGGKWDVARRVSIEAAAYHIDWKDAQITNLLVGPGGVTTTIVSGDNDVKGDGLDLALAWATPVDGLTLQLAGNVNNTKFTKVPSSTTAKVGDQIPGSPKKSANLSLTYRTQIPGFNVAHSFSYGYRGAQTEMTTGQASDSIRDLRVRFGLGQKNWDFSVYGQNLSNQKGVSSVLSALVVNPIQPRKIGADFNLRF
jgi:iron complex outermembrane receptor protein